MRADERRRLADELIDFHETILSAWRPDLTPVHASLAACATDSTSAP
jgi:hypothetical protein